MTDKYDKRAEWWLDDNGINGGEHSLANEFRNVARETLEEAAGIVGDVDALLEVESRNPSLERDELWSLSGARKALYDIAEAIRACAKELE